MIVSGVKKVKYKHLVKNLLRYTDHKESHKWKETCFNWELMAQ